MVNRQYVSKLNDLFDNLWVHGFAAVPRIELLLWHDRQQRVTKKLWRGIQEDWTQLCEDRGCEADKIPQILRAYNRDTKTWLLIWNADYDEETEQFVPWFKPISADDDDEDAD
jgi:hypothetical protein